MRAFSGLILAGGRGTRFGGPKAFARLPDGRTFLESCAENLQTAGADPILASIPRSLKGPLPDRILFRRVDHSIDMFGSLRLGLERLLDSERWQQVIILPVDHPLIEPETFRRLAATQSSAAIATYRGHHGHPVLLGRSVSEKIINNTLPGPTLREILRSADALDVEVDDPQARSNCNTPEVLARAWRLKNKENHPG